MLRYLWVAVLVAVISGCDMNSREREQGAVAFRAGVPAMANPYVGCFNSGPAWLDGWITAKAEQEKGRAQ